MMAAQQAALTQMSAMNQQNAQTIAAQIAADANKAAAAKSLLADNQTKISQILQDVTQNKANTQNKTYNMLAQLIRG
jgi:hypothetical protein